MKDKMEEPALYASPLDLPEGRSGPLVVAHRTVTGEVPIIGMRQAFLRRQRPLFAKVENLRIHELSEDNVGVWMTDSPEELEQIASVLREVPPHNDVLVGGLGLGLLAVILREHGDVDSVTVIEKSPDVIKLCEPEGVKVIEADIMEFLQRDTLPFDCYYLDTWQGTGESEWWHTVMPMRRALANMWGRQDVWCWAEDIMMGQCKVSAAHQGGVHWYYRALPENPDKETIDAFFDNVGLPEWEERWGKKVDAVTTKIREDVRPFIDKAIAIRKGDDGS